MRVLAAGDLHCRPELADELKRSFAAADQEADLVLLAGDLTTHGEPREAETLADACRSLRTPVIAVLGNHDWHSGRAHEVAAVLGDAGIRVLERTWTIHEIDGHEVGIVGAKGFVGGFAGCRIPDFGEPLVRQIYAETSAELEGIDAGLREIATCDIRIVLLHYAPTADTLDGEPPGIWPMLGSDRLAAPIIEHEPDLVLHGHAHAGTRRGAIATVPVHNVSRPVLERDFAARDGLGREFAAFDLSPAATGPRVH